MATPPPSPRPRSALPTSPPPRPAPARNDHVERLPPEFHAVLQLGSSDLPAAHRFAEPLRPAGGSLHDRADEDDDADDDDDLAFVDPAERIEHDLQRWERDSPVSTPLPGAREVPFGRVDLEAAAAEGRPPRHNPYTPAACTEVICFCEQPSRSFPVVAATPQHLFLSAAAAVGDDNEAQPCLSLRHEALRDRVRYITMAQLLAAADRWEGQRERTLAARSQGRVRMFAGQLPYSGAILMLWALLSAIGGYSVEDAADVLKKNFKRGGRVPSGCVTFTMLESSAEEAMVVFNARVLVDADGVWCAATEGQRQVLLQHEAKLNEEDTDPNPSYPVRLMTLERSTSTWQDAREVRSRGQAAVSPPSDAA